MIKDLAIYKLYKNVTGIENGEHAVDRNGNPVQLDWDLVNAEISRMQAEEEANAYKLKRSAEYPSIGDQLDALFHAGVFPEDMAAAIQVIKDKYPKGDNQ
jgi:hypothetical protein